MSDDFEFRIDPLLAQGSAGFPRQVVRSKSTPLSVALTMCAKCL